MHFFTFYLIFSLSKISEAFYSFQCPVQAHWKHRSGTSCNSGDSYFCLYDQNKNTFTEFCRDHPDFEAPGQKLIVAGSIKGTLQGADCDNDFYQPFQFLSSGSSRCAYEKSYCSGEGQTIFSNGTMEEDRLCRCDYRRGYDFIVRPKHQCYCVPTKEDCSCYIRFCSANNILSPDYECLDQNKWQTSFKCDQIVNVVLPKEIGIQSLETHGLVNYDIEKYRKDARVAVLLLVSSSFAITSLGICILKCTSLRLKKHSTDRMAFKDKGNIDEIKVSIGVANPGRDNIKMLSYIQDFQKETLQYWTNKLDKFVTTTATFIIYNHIKSNNVILIKGPTGVGKSINAYYVAVELQKKENYTVIPARQSVDIINYHVPGTKQIFIIDDVIGKYAVNETDTILWGEHESLMTMILRNNSQTKLILTTRTYVWSVEGHNDLTIPFQTCDFLSDDLKLSLPERLDICKSYINESDAKTLNEDTIMMYSFFPSICSMYSSSTKLQVKHFFTVPCQMFEDEINNFKTKSQVKFIALAFLAIRQMISKASLTIDNHEHDKLLEDLFNESSFLQYPSKYLIMSTLTAFKGEYVKELSSCFKFLNGTIQDIVLCCIAKSFMISVIKYCKTDVILNNFRLDCLNKDHDVLTIKVTKEHENAYFQRLITELHKGLLKEVFESAQNENQKFRVKFLKRIKLNITRNEMTKTQNKMTALHVVSALGYHEYVSFFINHTRMIVEQDEAGNIPLHLACMKGHLKSVKDLVEKNSPIDISNKEELKPFFYACENNYVEIAKYMLYFCAKWIKVNERYKTKNKQCVLHVVSANGYTNLAVLLLANNAEVEIKDADGCTPLHLACYKGNSGTVSALLKSDANVNAVDSYGKTSVYLACSENHERILQLLLEKNAVVNKKTVSGMTPLRVSCKNENIAVVNMLLKSGAKVNSKKLIPVPLHEACKVGNESIIDILIQAKASVNHKTIEGITPLHEACRNGHDNIVKILLDNKADVNAKDKHGWTALFFSSIYGFSTIVDLLLKNGANLNISDEDEETPLTLARRENHTDVIDLLTWSNSDVN